MIYICFYIWNILILLVPSHGKFFPAMSLVFSFEVAGGEVSNDQRLDAKISFNRIYMIYYVAIIYDLLHCNSIRI